MKFDATEYPDGYYILSSEDEPAKILVLLYDHEDFKGTRHLSFGHADGSALMPIWDLKDTSKLTPAVILTGEVPTTLKDLDELAT